MDPGIQRRGRGLAPRAALGARVLEATERVRPSGGDAGAEVAREVQRVRAYDMVGPPLWPGSAPAPRSRPDLSRSVGQRSVPVALPTGTGRSLVSRRNAGVDFRDRPARRPFAARRQLAPAAPRARAIRDRDAPSSGARRTRRDAGDVSPLIRTGGAGEAAPPHGVSLSHSTAGTPSRTAPIWPYPVAAAGYGGTRAAAPTDGGALERTLAGSRPAPADRRGKAQDGRCRSSSWGRLRTF